MINRDVKEPTHFSQRVGNVAPGVALWPCHGIHKPTFKPVLVSTRFLQTRFFKQDHFHIDFHLSLEKAYLRNFINFLKWREWFLYWKIIWNLQKLTFMLVTSPISYDCVKTITFVRLINAWVFDVLCEIYKNICEFFSTFCKPIF